VGVPVIREANVRVFNLLGYKPDELIDKPITCIDAILDPSDEIHDSQRKKLFGTGGMIEVSHKCKDGTILEFECSVTEMKIGSKIFAISFERDVTARKWAEAERGKLEKQLRESQKMEAIGSLAGGIAHDFNNLLTVILSYTQFVTNELAENDPKRQDLLEVRKAADRAVILTRQILAFSRKQLLRPIPLDLNKIVLEIEKMLRRVISENIEFVQALAPDLGLTLADPGQIEQVLMNLVVNARDAMPRGGKLTVRTANVEIDQVSTGQPEVMEAGSYVLLEVTDTGCGMDEATKARIFEPFYTTKEMGKGTGLGLSTVYGIVKQSGGNISVTCKQGQGSTFRIYLPREHAATMVGDNQTPKVPEGTNGKETILLVEDEKALGLVAKRALVAAGYKVLTAEDGIEAEKISAECVESIDLLLTDVIMPNRGGLALAQALTKTRPAMKILYMSGYTDDPIIYKGVLVAEMNFLAKPFSTNELTQKVRQVLEGVLTKLT
jgi:PAS domain S-box-containing protein